MWHAFKFCLWYLCKKLYICRIIHRFLPASSYCHVIQWAWFKVWISNVLRHGNKNPKTLMQCSWNQLIPYQVMFSLFVSRLGWRIWSVCSWKKYKLIRITTGILKGAEKKYKLIRITRWFLKGVIEPKNHLVFVMN